MTLVLLKAYGDILAILPLVNKTSNINQISCHTLVWCNFFQITMKSQGHTFSNFTECQHFYIFCLLNNNILYGNMKIR